MIQMRNRLSLALAITAVLSVFYAPTSASATVVEKVIYSFCNNSGCEGYEPYSAPLVMDAAGNLYGTAGYGGTYNDGAVFELSPSGSTWKYSVLYYFGSAENDGAYPLAGLIFDAKGNLYGTTSEGGANGSGTVFELTPNGGTWTETVLFSFNGNDGNYPQAGVVFDTAGNLYGTTTNGGTGTSCNNNCGVVFQLQPQTGGTWTEKVIHNFQDNGKDGWYTTAGVILDGSGNVYGTTMHGGLDNAGTVFELSPATGGKWGYKILHDFPSANGNPAAPLLLDSSGNLYGATYGGSTVFELSPPSESGPWIYQTLANIEKSAGGIGPYCGLAMDSKGNLYGTTVAGVGNNGVVFEVVNLGGGKWKAGALHNFDYNPNGGDDDGSEPFAGVIVNSKGKIFGVTAAGGTDNEGAVFELVPE